MTEAPAIDWSVLQQLADDMDDPEFADEILGLYRAELPGRRAALADALAGPGDALREAAHALKASSQSVGALRLGELCRDAEVLVSRGEVDQARTVAQQALAEIDRVEAAAAAGRPE